MNLSLPANKIATKFPSVKALLLLWLQGTVNTVARQQKMIPFLPSADDTFFITQKSDPNILKLKKRCSKSNEKLVTNSKYSLNVVNEDTVVLYICAIALKLSKSWGTSPIDIATQIEDQYSYLSNQELPDDPKKYFTLKVVPPAWLHLQLTDLGIATWLQSLASSYGSRGAEGQGGRGAEGQGGKPAGETRRLGEKESSFLLSLPPRVTASSSSQSPVPNTQSLIFSVQYAHARCCSLLRLAEQEGMIVLKQVDAQQSLLVWGAIAPDSIPWLNEIGQLRLTHPAERSLISQLFSALDAVYCPSSSQNLCWEKLAQEISLSWEKFYSQCRIWGEVKTEALELAQARLGLLMATQAMLRLLLEDYLGIPAPLEL